mgnify:CR=1 FL=1
MSERQANELVLPEGEHTFIQDPAKGVTIVRTGPGLVTLQGQERPVIYNPKTRRFDVVNLDRSSRVNTIVPKGSYAILQNPAKGAVPHPPPGSPTPAADLKLGEREYISGPASFALWPRQTADVVLGHQLRLNEYLLIRVYDEDAAKEHWSSAIVKKATSAPATGDDNTSPETSLGETPEGLAAVTDEAPEDLSVGRMLIVRGDEVSFFIPPTGIEVIPEQDSNYDRADQASDTDEWDDDNEGSREILESALATSEDTAPKKYVRNALTLERLQYCILINEDGNKRYVRGPAVVFPLPTERFHTNARGERKFRPIELNGKIQGIHIKVIARYTDTNGDHGEKGKVHKEGDELFITGETTPIYFPCEQHSAVKYDGQTRHFATAIPAGDGRYVLKRETGHIRVEDGGEKGKMLLPDPRKEVFARRALTDAECELMYPGNAEALAYNRALQALQAKAPTTRKGVVSEGEYGRSKRGRDTRMDLGDTHFANASRSGHSNAAEMGGDEFSRAASYTEPRTVTLGGDKFAGVPKINIWTGHAVMVVDSAGNRRVEIGPRRVLLGFDESLEALTLSTGKPKTTDHLLRTSYLQVDHNKVTDIVTAEAAKNVPVSFKVALRVNFEGEGEERNKWFGVNNYVKLLCDHVRSVLKSASRKKTHEELQDNGEDFVRDTILGAKPEGGERPGMAFPENGMRVYDVEVLKVVVGDDTIHEMLVQAQHTEVKTSIELAQAQRDLSDTKAREKIKQAKATAAEETEAHRAEIREIQIARSLKTGLAELAARIETSAKDLERQKAEDMVGHSMAEAMVSKDKLATDAKMEALRAEQTLKEMWLSKETKAMVDRLAAAKGGFAEALTALGDKRVLVDVAEAMSVQQFLGGKNLPEVVTKVFEGTPLAGLAQMAMDKAGGKKAS